MPTPITIDFSSVPDDNVLPEGPMEMIIADAILKDSNDGLSQFIQWDLEVTNPDHEGRRLIHRSSLKSTVAWRLKRDLKAAGADVSGQLSIEIDGEDRLTNPDVIGKAVRGVIIHEVYEGSKQSRISHLLPIDENPLVLTPSGSSLPRTAGAPKAEGGLKLR